MIFGTHVLIYTTDPEADRAFFRDVLDFRSVDIGHGWIIFKLPPSELALHPGDGQFAQRHAGHMMPGALVYLMCDDLQATMAALAKKNVVCTEVETENWGIRTTLKMPSGGEIGLYQPKHPTALDLAR
jgi:catechol 2,3-dioxygenase-like lactoylglutathione lyase family enzyme